jgi:transcriptional regulator with XRE-family HTH domain
MPRTNPSQVGRRVRQRRLELGWTQEILATKAGLCTSAISHIERGAASLSVESVCDLAHVLKTTTDFILLGRSA